MAAFATKLTKFIIFQNQEDTDQLKIFIDKTLKKTEFLNKLKRNIKNVEIRKFGDRNAISVPFVSMLENELKEFITSLDYYVVFETRRERFVFLNSLSFINHHLSLFGYYKIPKENVNLYFLIDIDPNFIEKDYNCFNGLRKERKYQLTILRYFSDLTFRLIESFEEYNTFFCYVWNRNTFLQSEKIRKTSSDYLFISHHRFYENNREIRWLDYKNAFFIINHDRPNFFDLVNDIMDVDLYHKIEELKNNLMLKEESMNHKKRVYEDCIHQLEIQKEKYSEFKKLSKEHISLKETLIEALEFRVEKLNEEIDELKKYKQ